MTNNETKSISLFKLIKSIHFDFMTIFPNIDFLNSYPSTTPHKKK